MKNQLLYLILVISLVGCANLQTYNPVVSATRQKFLLNESAMAQVLTGMTREQVHKILGESITIGYSQEEPLTIKNPYKTEDLNIKDQVYLVEYYVVCINQPDGVVTDDELMPLVFNKDQLVGKGKDYLKTLR